MCFNNIRIKGEYYARKYIFKTPDGLTAVGCNAVISLILFVYSLLLLLPLCVSFVLDPSFLTKFFLSALVALSSC